MIFHFKLFPEKNWWQNFSKYATNTIVDPCWVRFVHFWAAFPQKSVPTSFFKIWQSIKFLKKLKNGFRATLVSDGSMDRQALIYSTLPAKAEGSKIPDYYGEGVRS